MSEMSSKEYPVQVKKKNNQEKRVEKTATSDKK